MIFHITTSAVWEAARASGTYRGDSLENEGFIHCSTAQQVAGVANAVFGGVEGLVVLHIDESRLASPVMYENLEGGEEFFPHVYGSINSEAVAQVTALAAGPNGEFAFG
ncbi:MAG: DUF952 domain-containing protein [Dehalococcoidia bacterium]